MKNPTRRNRNIGTTKQGHAPNNRMIIPESWYDSRSFFEKLGPTTIVQAEGFEILVEQTRKNSIHACTVEDLIYMLQLIPKEDLGDLKQIVLRQPKRKEELLNSVWGRLVYAFKFQEINQPAIILEAVDLAKTVRRNKKMSLAGQEEFARLQSDGHLFSEQKQTYVAPYQLAAVRSTQLYRTLLHEIGHYVDYQRHVLKYPAAEREKREDFYLQIPAADKEKFAHTYSEKVAETLRAQGKIPFPRLLNVPFLEAHRLRNTDFTSSKDL